LNNLNTDFIPGPSFGLYALATSKKNNGGFTLLELTISMLVIGAMLAGVISAQIVMDMNKVHIFEADFRNIPQFINDYEDKYHAMPGDDPTISKPNSHLIYAVSCAPMLSGVCMPGNSMIDGKWNDTTAASESFIMWQQLRLAEFMSGDSNFASLNYVPRNVVGGALGVTSQANTPIVGLKGNFIVCSDNIAGKYVKQIDIALDDGSTEGGIMMATQPGTAIGGTPIPTSAIVDSQIYLLCMGV
jgi:prepilin-type N-terminal cleavage/methylation domain-containing protein